MNLMRMLKPGKWKIPSALLAGALALACVQCSVRSLVYLPPQPKDKTVYLGKTRRLGAPPAHFPP